jgi:hypothetical protein
LRAIGRAKHTTQLERREEGGGGLPRFGGSKPINFKLVIGGSKFDELVLHLKYFDLFSWFEDWLSKPSGLRGVLSVWVTEVSA